MGYKNIEYLGYLVSGTGIHKDMCKAQAIRDPPAPKDIKKLRRFLGMASYYQNFIPGFATAVSPLNELVSKKKKYVWETKHQLATDRLKDALCSDNEEYGVLRHPDFKLPFTIFTDASDHGVGAGRTIYLVRL